MITRSAYTRFFQGRWWIFIYTPSGDVVRLHLNYDTKAWAEHAMTTYGYELISEMNDNQQE